MCEGDRPAGPSPSASSNLTLEGENGDSALGVSSPGNSEVPI